MMKTVLLLAFAVLVSGNPLKNNKTLLLGELLDELNTALSRLPEEPEGKEIRLPELKGNGICPKHMFCQAADQLLNISGLTKYDDFRTDGRLMLNLNAYNKLPKDNKHHEKICEPVHKDKDYILLHDFLVELKKCVQNAFSNLK